MNRPTSPSDRWRPPCRRGHRPELAELTVDVLFDDVDQLRLHLGRARQDGVSDTKLVEAITHLALDAGWRQNIVAITVAKHVFAG